MHLVVKAAVQIMLSFLLIIHRNTCLFFLHFPKLPAMKTACMMVIGKGAKTGFEEDHAELCCASSEYLYSNDRYISEVESESVRAKSSFLQVQKPKKLPA